MMEPHETSASLRLGNVVDGVEQHPEGRLIEVRNPGRIQELVGQVVDSSSSDVDAAVAAAARAAASWAASSAAERIDRFIRIADEIDKRADFLATLTARENGSARDIVRKELRGVSAAFRAVQGYLGAKLAAVDHPTGVEGEFVRVCRLPLGVVACIVPWNAPLILTANKLVPALAAGNTVVLKPSPLAPLGVTLIGQLVASTLPRGVVNVVNGGAEAGDALISNPTVRKISFTGGGTVARSIMRKAADSLTNVHFELGGNDPAVVLDDADLRAVADRVATSAFRRSGQVCFAVKRVYVPRALHGQLAKLLVERVSTIRVGDQLDERVTMGPVISAEHAARIETLRDRARSQGRDVRELGTVANPDEWSGGNYLLPTLVLDARHEDEIVQVEQFGPILPLVAYDTEDEAVSMANDTEYGLCSSVWSRSRARALTVASRIEAGMTIVNNHLFSEVGTREIPFGGWKQSGIGWEGSQHGLDEYLQFHSIDVQRLV